MVISCSACKRFLPFWPGNEWLKGWGSEVCMISWGLGAALCSSRMAEGSVFPTAVLLTKGPSWAPHVQCIESLKRTWSMQALFNLLFFWTKIPTLLCLSPYSYTLHFGYLLYSLSICFKENIIQCLPKDLLFPINIAWKHLFPSYGSHNLCFGFLPVLCGKLMPSRDRNLIMRNLMGNSECLCCNWFWRQREREVEMGEAVFMKCFALQGHAMRSCSPFREMQSSLCLSLSLCVFDPVPTPPVPDRHRSLEDNSVLEVSLK